MMKASPPPGSVSKAELRQAFTRVGLDVTERELAAVLGNKESLTFDQFNQYVRKLAQETSCLGFGNQKIIWNSHPFWEIVL